MPQPLSSLPIRPTFRRLFIPALLCATFVSTSAAVRADSYHSVEAGETLSSIAARYNTRAQTLREANGISADDNAALSSMLLHIPDGNGDASKLPALSLQTPERGTSSGNGSITRSLRYTVRTGDTLESIVDRYAHDGFTLSVEAIRDKNNLRGALEAGRTLLLPIGGATYRANAAARDGQARTGATGKKVANDDDAVRISDEFDWPVATVVPNQKPVYQSPTTRRGPSVLGSRSYMPSPNLNGSRSGARPDGLQILQPGQDAPNSAPRKTNTRAVQAPVRTAPTGQKIARVAQVSAQGARIRRLPDSQAHSLYSCPVKTEIAVIRQNGIWSAILMSDRSTGWMPTRYLKFTGASVDISAIPVNNGYDNVRRYGRRGVALAGNFSSTNPMVARALTWMGTPYVYGGESRRGVDCSSLVQHCFRDNGIRLPRTAAEQAKVGMRVDPANLQAGDRLYFSASGSRVDHTGLYMGDGLFVHASGSGRAVIVSNLYDRWNWNIFVGARR